MDENWVKPSENKPKWVKMADLVKSHYNAYALIFPVLVHCTQYTSVNYKLFTIHLYNTCVGQTTRPPRVT